MKTVKIADKIFNLGKEMELDGALPWAEEEAG